MATKPDNHGMENGKKYESEAMEGGSERAIAKYE